MKKLIGFGIAAMMVMGLAGGAMAAPDKDWVINVKATTGATSGNTYTGVMGSLTGAAAALDTNDKDVSVIPGTTLVVWLGSVNGGNTNGLVKDYREYNGQKMTWDLQLFARGGTAAGAYVHVWNPDDNSIAGVYTNKFTPQAGETLKFYKVSSFASDATRELLWTWTGVGNGSTTGTYNSASAFSMDSKFQLELAPVPEPGSIVAMFSGLIGLAGYGIRRRK